MKQEWKNLKIAKISVSFSTFFQRQFWCPLTKAEETTENIKSKRESGASDNKLFKVIIVTNYFTEKHLKKELWNRNSNAGRYIFGNVMSNKQFLQLKE